MPPPAPQPVFGRKKVDETQAIKDRLDEGESIVHHATQSRILPGGAAGITPNTIFATNQRIIIRNPVRLGMAENIEEYFYHQITNVRLEKGLLSGSLIFFIPGMTEISKQGRGDRLWGRDVNGMIDGIKKEDAEKIYAYVRHRISEEKEKRRHGNKSDLAKLKTRLADGEITLEQFKEMKESIGE